MTSHKQKAWAGVAPSLAVVSLGIVVLFSAALLATLGKGVAWCGERLLRGGHALVRLSYRLSDRL
ncbi:MAG: hypothetical protein JSR66_24815 [Proteobacteria bacterium]|nr:hypothetical protein [Pseudomonadota bacterium]